MSVEVLKQIWPEWQIEGKPLGKGSFGVVYKAVRRDHNVESYAAIKVISIPTDPSEVDSLRSEGMDMNASRTYLQSIVNDFVDEIRIMESLKGLPNIVSVEDYKVVEKTGEIGWDIYIRMELLTTFSVYICDKKLTEEEVIKLGCDICTALEVCAIQKIIHRDIKPENIFINDFGYFKLGDFGIARKLENVTGGLSQKGSYNYMAPEVAKSNKYDARVDIYSLGIVLYRLLNGNRLPFLETERQLLNPTERRIALERRIRGDALPAPCEASPEMADVVLRACAYDPNNRFASAKEMKCALMSVANGTYQMRADKLDKTDSVRKVPAEDKTNRVRRAPSPKDVPDKPGPNAQAPVKKARKKNTTIITIAAVGIVAVLACLFVTMILPMLRYNSAVSLMEKENYQEAVDAFRAIGDYKDSTSKADECAAMLKQESDYQAAIALMEKGNYQEAADAFDALGDYKDSASRADECAAMLKQEADYQAAIALMEKGNYQEAADTFDALGDYKDSASKADESAAAIKQESDYQGTDYQETDYQETDYQETDYQEAIALAEKGESAKAAIAFGKIGNYKDAKERSLALWDNVAERNTVATDESHIVGLKSDGTVVANGVGEYGQRNLSEWTDIVAISTNENHTVGLKSDGTVVAAGLNTNGRCNVADWTDIVAVSAGAFYTVGLKSDGTVVAVGEDEDVQDNVSYWEDIVTGGCTVADWTDIVAVSAGPSYLVGLKSDGTVVAAGLNTDGRCNVADWTDIVAVSAGIWHTVGLKSDGTVVATGWNDAGQCNVADWTDIVAVSAGYWHTVGLKSDGTVVAVGEHQYAWRNLYNWTDIVAVSAGDITTVGLKSDGTVIVASGYDFDVSDFTDIKLPSRTNQEAAMLKQESDYQETDYQETDYQAAIALAEKGELAKAAIAFGKIGNYKDAKERSLALWSDVAERNTVSTSGVHMVGLKSDGTVVANGVGEYGQRNLSEWTDIVAISTGEDHTVGLKSDGTVVAAGSNECDQCNVAGWLDTVAISASDVHTVGLKSDGTVVAAGSNEYGQCNVAGWTDIVAVSGSALLTVGLKSDGTVVAAGSNEYGQCNVAGWTDIVAVSAGYGHTVGLKSDGTVLATGLKEHGRCNVADWTDIVAVSAGPWHTVGLKSDGTVVAVGKDVYDWLDAYNWTDIVAVSAGREIITAGLKSDGTVIVEYGFDFDVSDFTDIKLPSRTNL